MNPSLHRRPTGFTLIEMMAVITIIMILAAVVVGGTSFVNDRQAREKARIDISLLSKAIEEYKLDMGEYPGSDDNTAVQGDVSEELYEALFLNGYNYQSNGGSGTTKYKIYVPELDPRNAKQTWVDLATTAAPGATPLKIKDPWRNAYRYRKGQNAQNPDFDLWSCGKDGKTDAVNPSMKIKENMDDIRNF